MVGIPQYPEDWASFRRSIEQRLTAIEASAQTRVAFTGGTLSGWLTVQGAFTASGGAVVGNGLTVTGGATVAGGLTVTGATILAALTAASITTPGALAADSANITGNLASGSIGTGFVTTGGITVNGTTTANGAFAHTGGTLGFYGTAPGAKPNVTGSRGAVAALTSLLTGLAARGLITNSSTA